MEEQNIPQNTPDVNQNPGHYREPISKTDAMVGVFTEPGNTYESIAAVKGNYWVLPIVIAIVVGIIAVFIGQMDPQLFGDMMSKQRKKMEEKFQEQVKEGSMTQEQAQQSMEQSAKFMDPNGVFFKLIAFGGSIIGTFMIFIILSLLYLLGLKIFKAQFEFTNILNVVGLAMLISAIGGLIAIVLSVIMGQLTGVGLGLILKEEAVGEKMYALITKLDVFTIWFYAVISIGLSKIARIPMAKSVSLVFGIWIIYILVTTFVF